MSQHCQPGTVRFVAPTDRRPLSAFARHEIRGGRNVKVATVKVRFDVVRGRVEPVEMTIAMEPGERLTAELLRQPIAEQIDRARARHRDLAARAVQDVTLSRRDRAASARTMRAAEPGGPGRPPMSRDLLDEVSTVYREAHARGDPPVIAVAEHFDIPRATASGRIQRARSKGFLGATEPRRAGEQQPKPRRRQR